MCILHIRNWERVECENYFKEQLENAGAEKTEKGYKLNNKEFRLIISAMLFQIAIIDGLDIEMETTFSLDRAKEYINFKIIEI
ncbi:hypothetical protein JM83_1688 [Gillisia sp. Hel_I_86]|uniref:hypothetical protein n=1 Tax=Gillisia sp. Hel_I_86 TaxID=1249981 RepID=UPI00119A1882|nr:hypothetical protein [Gillisia sp. Hel_I_86]TVZ26701.1 hypothetical protein JM83_1688 [Gillisia sp. Hel_I_86]